MDATIELRDIFAMCALAGRLAAERNSTQEDGFAGYEDIALEAYGLADAMLKVRNKL